MDVLKGALRVARTTVEASAAAAGSVGGAAINGIVGGVQGAVSGARKGFRSGSRSTPAAALTVAAAAAVVGAAGLVEWPVLLPVGGTVLAVQYAANRSGGEDKRASTRRVGSRPAAKGRSGARASTPHTAARSRRARSAR